MKKHYNKVIHSGFLGMTLLMMISLVVSPKVSAQVDTLWSIQAPTSNWFGIGNTERGLTFNPSTGNLILASRQGGVTPVIINAETGDSLGLLKTMQPAKEAPVPVWSFSAPQSTWFGTGNTERGLGFNPATGNLIVASRQGGVTPVLVDAASGDSVGMLQTIRKAKEVAEPLWTIEAPTSNWFTTANTERGLGFNPATGNLIVASRQGGVSPILVNSATGDSVGELLSARAKRDEIAPVWSIDAPRANWFGTGNTERGLGFNPATGNLIVASRQGGVTPVLVDAATGDSVGILKNKDITFSENFEGISASGDAVTGWVFTNAQTWVLGGYGNNSDKYAGWGESVNGDHSIQSPLITNPGVLSFYIAGYNDATNTKVVVETSPDGTTWTSVDTLITKGAGGDIGVSYVKKSYNLNKTGDYYIRWATTEHVDGGFYLDDIEFNNPISGGTFAFNQIKASADGQIFTANLAINSTTKIYRWASETAEPELVYSGDLTGRLGDSFGVVGSADSVWVTLSGSTSDKVHAFRWDGTSLSLAASYDVAVSEARGGFSARTINDSTIISGTGTAPRFMNILDGTLGTQIASETVAPADLNSVMVNDQFQLNGRHFMAAGPAFTNGKFYLMDITDPDSAVLVHEFGPIGENANLNNTGGVIYDQATKMLYLMDTNNALQAYNMLDFFDTQIVTGGIFPFNQIKATADGQIFTANLAINGESRIYRWADEMAEPEMIYAGTLGGRLGDSFGVIGSGDDVHIFLSGTGAEKVAAFHWDGMDLSLTAEYPVAAGEARGGFSGHVIADSIIISGTGTAPRFMNVKDGGLGTQLASDEIAPADLNSVMVNDQVSYYGRHLVIAGPAFTNGKFYLLDITNGVKTIAELGPLGNNANLNNTGGAIFDEGRHRLYLMDSNNALMAYDLRDFVDTPIISGGIFPFNQIKATVDGQIFTANLAINGTSKIYRWADESSAPELVFQGDLGGRLGDSFGVIGEGAAVRVFLSGSGAEKVAVFNWNGSTMDLLGEFPVAAGEARGGFSSHVVGDSILISGTGTAPRFMHVGDGGLGTQLMSDEVAPADLNSVMVNDQVVYNGRHLVAAGPAFTNGKFYVLDVTDEVTLLAELGPLGENANLNNTGGAVFDEARHMMYLMDTNNSIVAYNMRDFFASPVISGGIFPFNQVKATSDGQIFTANLAINGVTKIYRWANESAAPEAIFADSLGQRLGDSFAAYGSGDDVTLLLSGGGADKVVAFHWNGSALDKTADFEVAPGEARGGFSNYAVNDSVWITGTGTAPRAMNIKDGTLGSTFVSNDVTENILNSSMLNDQAMVQSRHLVAFGPAFSNGKFYLFDVTNGMDLIAEIDPLGLNVNGNNTGAVVFDPTNSRLYLMDTNNAIVAFDISGVIVSNEQIADVPAIFKLYDNYPNPFNPTTNIQYDLPVASDVSIKVYDIQGRMIANIAKGQQTAGTYTHRFDAGSMASGMYIYRIEAGSFVATKKMMLIK